MPNPRVMNGVAVARAASWRSPAVGVEHGGPDASQYARGLQERPGQQQPQEPEHHAPAADFDGTVPARGPSRTRSSIPIAKREVTPKAHQEGTYRRDSKETHTGNDLVE